MAKLDSFPILRAEINPTPFMTKSGHSGIP